MLEVLHSNTKSNSFASPSTAGGENKEDHLYRSLISYLHIIFCCYSKALNRFKVHLMILSVSAFENI